MTYSLDISSSVLAYNSLSTAQKCHLRDDKRWLGWTIQAGVCNTTVYKQRMREWLYTVGLGKMLDFYKVTVYIKTDTTVHLFLLQFLFFIIIAIVKFLWATYKWKQSSNALLILTLHVFYNNQCNGRINYLIINLHLVLFIQTIFVLFTGFFFSFSHMDL